MGIDLKVAQLRKLKGVSQQELADYLGVTFQSVSKWETKNTLPDITLLPDIAEYFEVTVDEVLGLVPIHSARYIPRNTDDRSLWEDRKKVIENDRMFLWNDDYLSYLVKTVWKIEKPVDLIEFCCCDGDLGKRLMAILPEGSTYTGVDSEYLVKRAEENFRDMNCKAEFIVSDIYGFVPGKQYDMSICQAALRHMNRPLEVLRSMKDAVKENGLVVCVEINREIENVGLYIDGIPYDRLCTSFDWRKLWLSELEKEGRDYAVGMRVPFYMEQLGLRNIGVRMNDKAVFIPPSDRDDRDMRGALAAFRGWDFDGGHEVRNSDVDFFMSRGYKRQEVEALYDFQKETAKFIRENREHLSFLHIFGFLISYGRK